jgi:1-phosphofructokinase
MITTVTLNPSIDREYFVENHIPGNNKYIYDHKNRKVTPGGKGLIAAINLKRLGYSHVQNIGFVGGRQGMFFEKMVQEFKVTTNYVYTENEIRNNVKIIGKDPVTYTQFNDYTYRVNEKEVEELLKRFRRGIVDSEFIMLAGSLPEGVDFSIYRQLIEICKEEGKKVFLQASGEALNRALDMEPDVVAPYFKHTDKILDMKVNDLNDFIEAGNKLLNRGANYAVLPFHCDRLLFTPEGIYTLTPLDFCLRNWLGAGDAYNAAFFDYIHRYDFDFIEANRYSAAAALSIAEENSIFIKNRDEIKKNIERMVVREVEV